MRNYASLNPYLISTYDVILRNRKLAEKLAPNLVIQVGSLPTSKELRAWLNSLKCPVWIIDSSPENLDPLHGSSMHLRTSIEHVAATITSLNSQVPETVSDYRQHWCDLETKVRQTIEKKMISMDDFFEGKAAWLLSVSLPEKTPIFIANSMPVRDVEFFWTPSNSGVIPYFNRGANGIDGTLSTALGIAHRHQSCVMLTGDLALLHDTNGFLIKK